MRNITILLFACLLAFAGCAKTRVVLLPDSDNNVGSVTVASESGVQVLDKANQYTEVSSKNSKPSEPEIMQEQTIEQKFERAIAVLPEKPVSFLLYFRFGTDQLTDESKALIPEVLKAVHDREPSEVSIIGHSDSMGPAEYNVLLSLQRAQEVRDMIQKTDTTIKSMEVSSHGENDQLIKTKDNVSEPRNRRVEIMVK